MKRAQQSDNQQSDDAPSRQESLSSTHAQDEPQVKARSEHARVGAMIREARERANLSLQDLADRVGCVKSYLSAIETDRRSVPGDDVLIKIEAALGLVKGRLVYAARWQKSLEVGGVAVQRDLAEMQKQHVAAKRLATLLQEFRSRDAGKSKNTSSSASNASTESSQSSGTMDIHAGSPLDAAYHSGELAKLVDQISPPPLSAADMTGRGGRGGRGDAIVPVPLPLEVPLINSVAAGYPTEFTDLGYPARVADEYVRCPDVHDADAFAARVVGDSMEPIYFEGDIVVFSPLKALASGQDCFARIEPDHSTTFKRVFFEKNPAGLDVIRLQPLNNRYPPSVYLREQVAGLYAAVNVIRKIP